MPFLKWFREQLKWLIARDEMERLERYQLCCQETVRWHAHIVEVADTAEYIRRFGEGEQCPDIVRFREGIVSKRRQFPL